MKKIRSSSLLSVPRSGLDFNMVANVVQTALLLVFGYWLLEASLAGEVDHSFLAWWTGFTAIFCGGLTLSLELTVVTGWTRTLTVLEAFGYLLWLGTEYIGIPITDSPLKTGGILGIFIVWNGFQLCWRMSQLRAGMRKRSVSFEDLVNPAEAYARKRGVDITTFLQEIQQIVRDGTPREKVMDTWSSLPPGHTREFLRRAL